MKFQTAKVMVGTASGKLALRYQSWLEKDQVRSLGTPMRSIREAQRSLVMEHPLKFFRFMQMEIFLRAAKFHTHMTGKKEGELLNFAARMQRVPHCLKGINDTLYRDTLRIWAEVVPEHQEDSIDLSVAFLFIREAIESGELDHIFTLSILPSILTRKEIK